MSENKTGRQALSISWKMNSLCAMVGIKESEELLSTRSLYKLLRNSGQWEWPQPQGGTKEAGNISRYHLFQEYRNVGSWYGQVWGQSCPTNFSLLSGVNRSPCQRKSQTPQVQITGALEWSHRKKRQTVNAIRLVYSTLLPIFGPLPMLYLLPGLPSSPLASHLEEFLLIF